MTGCASSRYTQSTGERIDDRATSSRVSAALAEVRQYKHFDTIEVTPDDFRALMQERADKVRNYLLQTGQVAAERMFIVALKPVDPSYQGQSRVDLSLE